MLITSIIALLLALYVWPRRSSPGGLYFSLLMLAAGEWALMGYMEMAVVGLQAKVICTQLSYLSVTSIGPLWLLFALDYSQRRQWLTHKRILLMWVVPAMIIGLVMTNGIHGLIWPEITLVSDAPGSIPVYQHGIAYWVHTVYTYSLMVAGIVILASSPLRVTGNERFRTMILLIGVIITTAGSLPYIFSLKPLSGIDLTPVAFTATGIFFAWQIFRHRLFDIVPVAWKVLTANMGDGVIVIDNQGMVIELNIAARKLIGAYDDTTPNAANLVLDKWPELKERCCEGDLDSPAEIMVDSIKGPRWIDTRISPLSDAGGFSTGRLIILRDITESKRSEEALKQFNESLQTEMKERKKAEEIIRASLNEKEVLLKEIHHRVKNNLQIISSLLNLQSGYADQESAIAFKESQNRIRSMALIHEKLYQSRDLARIDFASYVSSLTTHLARSYTINPGVDIAIEVDNISLDIDTAIPCGLIINELVSNSLKYAFKDGRTGTVTVSMIKDNGVYMLQVGDNGTGLPPGIDYKNTDSLGLQLVNMLAGQIGGTMELDKSHGTAFRIYFPERKPVGVMAE